MSRSLLKALSYRVVGSACTILVTLTITGSLPEAGAVTVLLVLVKVAGYVLHDRAWSYVLDQEEEHT